MAVSLKNEGSQLSWDPPAEVSHQIILTHEHQFLLVSHYKVNRECELSTFSMLLTYGCACLALTTAHVLVWQQMSPGVGGRKGVLVWQQML